MPKDKDTLTWTELVEGLPTLETDLEKLTPEQLEHVERVRNFFVNMGVDPTKENVSEDIIPLEDSKHNLVFPSQEEIDRKYPPIKSEPIDFCVDSGEKLAYPNYEQFADIPGQHNTEKWLQAVKQVYYDIKKGEDRNIALRQATNGWKHMEIFDFLNWLRYYESNNQLKYKKAQNWYGDADIGYLLPVKQDTQPAKDETPETKGMSKKKREEIENQRKKIIGRLDSAEKLIRSLEGQELAEEQFESLLKVLHELKQKVYLVNKKSTSSKTYEDMIVREANILVSKGFTKAAGLFLYALDKAEKKVEEAPPEPPEEDVQEEGAEPAMTATPPLAPTDETVPTGSGEVGGLPMPEGSPGNPDLGNNDPAISQFLEGLETGTVTDSEDLEVNDVDDDLVVEAQVEAPLPDVPPPPKPAGPKQTDEEPLEITEEEDSKEPSKDLDKMVESVFSNLTIAEVVSKFEDIAKFYKTREMARQLALADMMLDSLGLAPFFPSLSEATNKALEANNYILTRIEEIIARLRGTLKTKDIDMTGETNQSPEMENIQKKLEQQEQKEKERKEKRREAEELEAGKEVPEIEITEDLEPAPAPAPAPVPAPKAPRPA